MKNVLVVDDEEAILLTMAGRFEDYKDQFNVFTAGNGKEAIKVLKSSTIDLVITDLKMPVMDGIELLAYMSTNFPTIPAITVSAFCTPKIQKVLEAMGTLRVMDKPVDLDLLAQSVLEGLQRSHQGGSINCISVGSFMQLLQMEARTCMLEVHGEEQKRGYLYLTQGELYDATCGELEKEQAAYEMIAWDSVQLYIKNLPNDRIERRITKGMMSIVMEGLRRKDEAAFAKIAKRPEPESVTNSTESNLTDELNDLREVFDKAEDTTKPDESIAHQKKQKIDGARKAEFTGKVFNIIHSNLKGSKLLYALIKELQGIISVDLAVLMSMVSNKPGYFKIDDLIAFNATTIRQGAVYSWQNSNFSAALHQKAPLVVTRNGSLSKGIEKKLFEDSRIQSCLLIPLLTDGIVSGALALAATKVGDFFTIQKYMDWIACGLSLVIERNRLSAVALKQKEALDTARQIGRALVSSNFDIEKILNFSMDKIRKIMNVEAGSLFLKEKDSLKLAVAFNTKVGAIKNFRLQIGQGIAGQVAAKGKSMMVNDPGKSSQCFGGIDKHIGFKTQSILCVPLVVQKKLIGVIEVLNKINGDFGADDEAILLSLAGSISLALMKTRFQKQTDLKAHHDRDMKHPLQ